ncbi:hypothetical protein [Lapillicoccus sp.]|uniref:hypothetical protein n=1 Tax=Lapillicoccus sp. TaxID=1909287 RepID=UPI0025F9F89D|nr:hypothetical protein [Lapillicoccus sp.]
MAMHIHGSFSEQHGSMEGHLQQATLTGVNVLWWTDHDHRMEQWKFRNVVHFDSLAAEAGDEQPWTWQLRTTGSLASSSGGIQTTNVSPNDTPGSGALSVSARASTGTASYGYYANAHPAGWNYHGNIFGQTLTIDVFMPTVNSGDSYLEVLIGSSWHPARNGRPAGCYSLSYRFDASGAPASTNAQGVLGVVTRPVIPGEWNTVSLTPSTDVATVWPDMQADDFASFALTLNAVSGGSAVCGVFDLLRFTRQYTSGDVPLQRQQTMMSAYAAPYPNVTQMQGLELSLLGTHLNWFGPGVTLPDFTGITGKN